MTDWDVRWIGLARHIAEWSKDQSRKTAAVIVDDRNCLLAIGWNGFPRGVDDCAAERHERPAKYVWTEHAERNAIYNAAALGVSVRGATCYLPWYPCMDCARALIQSGISKLICVEPDWNDPHWAEHFSDVPAMLAEGGVQTVFTKGLAA